LTGTDGSGNGTPVSGNLVTWAVILGWLRPALSGAAARRGLGWDSFNMLG
jgi:hypothetical protein